MKIINWKTSTNFFTLLESFREAEEDLVLVIGRGVPVGWYHIALIRQVYVKKSFVVISRDERIRRLLKHSPVKCYLTLQAMYRIMPEGYQIISENLTPFEYVRYHVGRFFTPVRNLQTIFKKRHTRLAVGHTSWFMLVLGIVVVLLLLIGIVSLATPRAVITIIPQPNTYNPTRNVTFVLEDMVTDIGQIPVRRDTYDFEFKKTYHNMAYDPNAFERARGFIKVSNMSADPIQIRPNSRVLVDTLVFRNEKWIEVPGATAHGPGVTVAPVIAEPFGTSGSLIGKFGNIPENTVLIFPGLPPDIQEKVTVTAREAFTGGGDGMKNLLTQEELSRLEVLFREQFLDNVRENILKDISVNNEYIPLPIANTITPLDIIVESSDKPGSDASEITLSGKGNFALYLYHAPSLRRLLLDYTELHLLKDTESLIENTPKPADIVDVLATTENPWSIKATVKIDAQVLYDFNSKIGKMLLQNILADLLGSEVNLAEKSLKNHSFIRDVRIHLTPFWTHRLPRTLDTIYTKVENP